MRVPTIGISNPCVYGQLEANLNGNTQRYNHRDVLRSSQEMGAFFLIKWILFYNP